MHPNVFYVSSSADDSDGAGMGLLFAGGGQLIEPDCRNGLLIISALATEFLVVKLIQRQRARPRPSGRHHEDEAGAKRRASEWRCSRDRASPAGGAAEAEAGRGKEAVGVAGGRSSQESPLTGLQKTLFRAGLDGGPGGGTGAGGLAFGGRPLRQAWGRIGGRGKGG
jgi:hypothetical protein